MSSGDTYRWRLPRETMPIQEINMGASATIFAVDPDESITTFLHAIALEMQVQCESFSQAEDFLDAYEASRPGCLVTEFRLLGMNGVELQELLAAECSALPVVFVTGHAETRLCVRAMQNGAITVLEKPLSHQELWDALRKALTHDKNMRRIDARHSHVRKRLANLTPKERQVLDLMIQGKANKVIAHRLAVSIRTVEARRHQIFKKTATDSIAELVKLILLTEPDESSS